MVKESYFYKNSKLYEFWNNFIFPATEKVRKKKIFEPRVKKIIEICKKFKVEKKKNNRYWCGFWYFL